MHTIPLVSVILPTFNRANLIERSIESVLAQTWRDFELIIIDDGSTDNTKDILNQFNDNRIKVIKEDCNKGASHARNDGLKVSNGRYIAFQDSDDEWMPDKLEKQVDILKDNTHQIGVVYSDMLRINKDSIDYWSSPEITSGELIDPITLDYKVFGVGIGSALILKECFYKCGTFDERLRRFIDMDFFIRVSKYYRFYHIKEPLVKYYATEGISSDLNALCISRILLMEKYYSEIKYNDDFILNQYSIILEALQEERIQIDSIKSKIKGYDG